jgi:hypothetical protein
MSNIPAIFASIMASSKVDPLIKYRSTFAFSSAADVASISQARAFSDILMQDVATKNKILPRPLIVAQQSGPAVVSAQFIPIEDMIADGFPVDHQCHLHFIFAMGPEREGDELGNGITNQVNSKILEVADSIRFWFEGHPEYVYLDITR